MEEEVSPLHSLFDFTQRPLDVTEKCVSNILLRIREYNGYLEVLKVHLLFVPLF